MGVGGLGAGGCGGGGGGDGGGGGEEVFIDNEDIVHAKDTIQVVPHCHKVGVIVGCGGEGVRP